LAGAAYLLNHNAGTGLNWIGHGGKEFRGYAVLTRENAAGNSSWRLWKSESGKECVTTHWSGSHEV
jgi:hypothetical protein